MQLHYTPPCEPMNLWLPGTWKAGLFGTVLNARSMNCGGGLRAVTKKYINAAMSVRLNKDEELGGQVEALAASLDGGWTLIFRS